MQFRAFVNLQIERIYLANSGRNVLYDAHLDRRGLSCGPELSSQLGTRSTVERFIHVISETRIVDVQLGHRQAGYPHKSAPYETLQGATIFGWKFLEHDDRHFQLARFWYDGRCQKF